MTNELKEHLLSIAAASHEDRVEYGRRAVGAFIHGLREGGLDDEKINFILVAYTRLFVSADKSCERGEYELFRDITKMDISGEEFYNLTNGGKDPEFVSNFIELASKLTPDDRAACLAYGASIIGADGSISDEEFELFDRILNA